MPELIVNLHMHTRYSDGSGTHQDIAQAALRAGLDVVIVTDHNVWVEGVEGYFTLPNDKERRVLLLVGEEVHNPMRQPQKSHTLVLGAAREMATFGSSPQTLIDQAGRVGALTFLAHPYDRDMPAIHETSISWEDWDARGYTGLELWNGFSEIKCHAHNILQTAFYVFFPRFIAHGPQVETLKKWDDLTRAGQNVAVVGGSDAHAMKISLGPIKITVFPYEFHFRAVNTHILADRDLSGDPAADRLMVMDALRKGHAFIGYDQPASTRGFRFTAQGQEGTAQMGDEIRLRTGVTLQVKLPFAVECRLLRDGQVVKTWADRANCTFQAAQAGVYRVECYVQYLGRRRGWIYSNPIYVR